MTDAADVESGGAGHEPKLASEKETRGKNVVQVAQGDREIAAVAVEEPSWRLFVIYGPSQNLRGGVVYQ